MYQSFDESYTSQAQNVTAFLSLYSLRLTDLISIENRSSNLFLTKRRTVVLTIGRLVNYPSN